MRLKFRQVLHPNRLTEIRMGFSTDKGRVREVNEDSLSWSEESEFPRRQKQKGRLYVVADGMGGYQAGEIASQLGVETVVKAFEAAATEDVPAILEKAIHEANQIILEKADKVGMEGMGTTMVAVVVRGEELYIAHIGDSRAYLLRNGQLSPLTRDHTVVNEMYQQGTISAEEAEQHPRRHVLSRALGRREDMVAEISGPLQLREKDLILMCSDGISGYMTDDQIGRLLRMNYGDPQSAAQALVQQADAEGGQDNATAIILEIDRIGN